MRLCSDEHDPGFMALMDLSWDQRKGLRIYLDGELLDQATYVPRLADDEQGIVDCYIYDDGLGAAAGGLRHLRNDGRELLRVTFRGKVRIEIPKEEAA